MPTYQYACTDPACDHRFEQFQSFTDEALTDCPVCAGRLRKVYGSVGVVFKGSGFYRNDARAEANGAKKKAHDKDSASSSTSSADSSSSASSAKDSSPTKDSTSSTTNTEKSSAKAATTSASSTT